MIDKVQPMKFYTAITVGFFTFIVLAAFVSAYVKILIEVSRWAWSIVPVLAR